MKKDDLGNILSMETLMEDQLLAGETAVFLSL